MYRNVNAPHNNFSLSQRAATASISRLWFWRRLFCRLHVGPGDVNSAAAQWTRLRDERNLMTEPCLVAFSCPWRYCCRPASCWAAAAPCSGTCPVLDCPDRPRTTHWPGCFRTAKTRSVGFDQINELPRQLSPGARVARQVHVRFIGSVTWSATDPQGTRPICGTWGLISTSVTWPRPPDTAGEMRDSQHDQIR